MRYRSISIFGDASATVATLKIIVALHGIVHGCPLQITSTTNTQDAVFYNLGDNLVTNIEDIGDESRALQSSTSSFLSRLMVQIVKLVIVSVLGKTSWFSEDVAIRRLDELKSTLFSYYARGNLFGVPVERARDGIGFPSLTGALLSLAFLISAVFLIDLIQTVLNKLRFRNAVVTSAPAFAVVGRTFSPLETLQFSNLNKSTTPYSIERLTTLSSKVLSSIEKPLKPYT